MVNVFEKFSNRWSHIVFLEDLVVGVKSSDDINHPLLIRHVKKIDPSYVQLLLLADILKLS